MASHCAAVDFHFVCLLLWSHTLNIIMPGQQGKYAVTTRSSVSSTDTAPPAWAVTIQDDLSFLKGKNDSIPADIAAMLEPIKSENIKLNEKVHDLEDKVRDQQCDITYLKSKCQSTSDRLIRMEAYSMRENLVLTGVTNQGGSKVRITQTMNRHNPLMI